MRSYRPSLVVIPNIDEHAVVGESHPQLCLRHIATEQAQRTARVWCTLQREQCPAEASCSIVVDLHGMVVVVCARKRRRVVSTHCVLVGSASPPCRCCTTFSADIWSVRYVKLGMQQHEVKSSQRQCWARLLPNVRV
jgi:hypothetical protein